MFWIFFNFCRQDLLLLLRVGAGLVVVKGYDDLIGHLIQEEIASGGMHVEHFGHVLVSLKVMQNRDLRNSCLVEMHVSKASFSVVCCCVRLDVDQSTKGSMHVDLRNFKFKARHG